MKSNVSATQVQVADLSPHLWFTLTVTNSDCNIAVGEGTVNSKTKITCSNSGSHAALFSVNTPSHTQINVCEGSMKPTIADSATRFKNYCIQRELQNVIRLNGYS